MLIQELNSDDRGIECDCECTFYVVEVLELLVDVLNNHKRENEGDEEKT